MPRSCLMQPGKQGGELREERMAVLAWHTLEHAVPASAGTLSGVDTSPTAAGGRRLPGRRIAAIQ